MCEIDEGWKLENTLIQGGIYTADDGSVFSRSGSDPPITAREPIFGTALFRASSRTGSALMLQTATAQVYGIEFILHAEQRFCIC